MQKSLIAVIADRYRQQDFDALTSKDDLKPADIRRICFDLGIALIISALFQKVIFVAMVFLLRGFVSAGLDTGSTLFTVLNYTFSNISTYLPKILAFGAVYLKYRPLRRLDTQYENKSYYPLIFIPAMFAFAMWGSNITTCINYILQLLFGVGEIENVMDAIAPSSFSSGVVTLIFTAFVAPVFEEMISLIAPFAEAHRRYTCNYPVGADIRACSRKFRPVCVCVFKRRDLRAYGGEI